MRRGKRLYRGGGVALAATLGSLYFSEIRGYIPCVLCWFQRVCMYPLVVVLGVAAFRGETTGRGYALPLAVIGWGVALTQNLEIWGVIKTLKICSVGQTAAGCDVKWPIFGDSLTGLSNVVTIPVLSLIAFSAVIALLSWRRQLAL